MEQKKIKLKDIIIALVISTVIGIVAISIQNGIKNKRQINSMVIEYKAALNVQVQVADKSIKWKYDEKISGNNIYIYFYADDIYTEQNYGDGYIKINREDNKIDVEADTERLRDILVKVKYSNK